MKRLLLASAMAVSALAWTGSASAELVVYSGRGEAFSGPILKLFEQQTGIKVKARYGSTAELSALLKEEGDKSPADVFWAQDAGALGANAARFAALPATVFDGQPAAFKSPDGKWVATSGRARVLAYSTKRLKAEDLPKSVYDLTKPEWKGKVAFAPKNASFQAFVTAVRATDGEAKAKELVQGLVANGAKQYSGNVPQVQAIADGEVDVALVNTYYLTRFKLRDPAFPVAQTFFASKDIGNLLFVSGVGVLASSDDKGDAQKLVDFLLSPATQQYTATSIGEYPVISGVIENQSLGPVADPSAYAPPVGLDKLDDLAGTQKLLTELGLL